MHQTTLTCTTYQRGFTDITPEINNDPIIQKTHTGLCHLFIQHTSASLIISENFDETVREDLENYMARLVQDGDALFKHTAEGIDDMSAHIRSILTATNLVIPVQNYTLALGRWQAVYLWEHRFGRHERKILMTVQP